MDSNNNSTYSTTQKKLVVAEKPSVAKSIAKVLGADERKDGYMEGNGFIVSWCVGHLVELAQPDAYSDAWKKWTYDSLPMIPEHWQHEVKKDTIAQFRVLKELMHDTRVDSVVCATDVGRILRTFKIKKNVEVTDNGKIII